MGKINIIPVGGGGGKKLVHYSVGHIDGLNWPEHDCLQMDIEKFKHLEGCTVYMMIGSATSPWMKAICEIKNFGEGAVVNAQFPMESSTASYVRNGMMIKASGQTYWRFTGGTGTNVNYAPLGDLFAGSTSSGYNYDSGTYRMGLVIIAFKG